MRRRTRHRSSHGNLANYKVLCKGKMKKGYSNKHRGQAIAETRRTIQPLVASFLFYWSQRAAQQLLLAAASAVSAGGAFCDKGLIERVDMVADGRLQKGERRRRKKREESRIGRLM